jgi:hypothetical protein
LKFSLIGRKENLGLKHYFENDRNGQGLWHMAVIPATWEAEIERIAAQGQLEV